MWFTDRGYAYRLPTAGMAVVFFLVFFLLKNIRMCALKGMSFCAIVQQASDELSLLSDEPPNVEFFLGNTFVNSIVSLEVQKLVVEPCSRVSIG